MSAACVEVADVDRAVDTVATALALTAGAFTSREAATATVVERSIFKADALAARAVTLLIAPAAVERVGAGVDALASAADQVAVAVVVSDGSTAVTFGNPISIDVGVDEIRFSVTIRIRIQRIGYTIPVDVDVDEVGHAIAIDVKITAVGDAVAINVRAVKRVVRITAAVEFLEITGAVAIRIRSGQDENAVVHGTWHADPAENTTPSNAFLP
jgi:hypothetical protein